MNRYKIIVVFCFCFQFVTAQNLKQVVIDSVLHSLKKNIPDTTRVNMLNKLSKIYIYKDYKKGVFYAQKGLQLSTKLNWKKGVGISNKNIGMHLVSKGDYAKAMNYFKIAENDFNAGNDVLNLASLYNEIGILKANQGKFPESLNYFFKSLSYYENLSKSHSQKSIAACYENIGTIYNLTNSYENAIINYKKAIAILEKIKEKEVETAINIANIGTIYQKQGKNKNALETYKKAALLLKPHNDDFSNAFVNSWTGSVYLALKNYDLSIETSNKALKSAYKTGDKELTTTTIQNIGYAHLKKAIATNSDSHLENALKNLSLALKMHKELGNHEGIIKDYLYLSEFYDYKKEFEKSLAYHKKYVSIKDSIFNFKNKQSLQNLEDERTIELSSKEIQLNKIKLANKEKQKWYLIGGILSLCVIGGLLFYQSRNRKKTNEKLQVLNSELDEANKTKTRFFSILNHDLRSPVSNLIHFLHLQKESPELLDEESKKRLENKTISGAENLLTSMEDILLWSKGQMENFKPQPNSIKINTLFEDTRKHFESEEKVSITFENPYDLSLVTDENYLKTIVRNLTGNAIKALNGTDNPTINWRAWEEKGTTYLSIIDNGSGATQDQFKALYDENEVVGIKTGLGLHLIRDLAKAIQCDITVDSKVDKGTTFTLQLK